MQVLQATVESYSPNQKVRTSFGIGIVKAISHIDSIVYVTLLNDPASLYLFHPEQVEVVDGEAESDVEQRNGF